jgi:uncharacterized membrane protein
MTQQKTDRLVEDYLGAVSYACVDLPPDRRDELIEDLREHITAARAVLYEPTEAAIRTILDRLGEPSAIAEEALATEPGSRSPQNPRSEPRDATPVGRGPSPATLGMVLGFVLIVILILVAAALLMAAR